MVQSRRTPHQWQGKPSSPREIVFLKSCSCSFYILQTTNVLYSKSQASGLAASNSFHMLHRRAETELRHVAVNAFELIRVDCVRLMPDAHASIRADRLVELLPRAEVRVVGVTREPFQILEGA